MVIEGETIACAPEALALAGAEVVTRLQIDGFAEIVKDKADIRHHFKVLYTCVIKETNINMLL